MSRVTWVCGRCGKERKPNKEQERAMVRGEIPILIPKCCRQPMRAAARPTPEASR